MRKKTLKIETVHQCNCCLGSTTLHPSVSVIDLSKNGWTDFSVRFGFYTILLIENECDCFRFGRKYYDYSNATLLFVPPGQSIQMDDSKPLPRKGWLLAFHPQLICGTALEKNIENYSFFSYQADEALHLSLREKTIAIECLTNIEQELLHAIDRHSRVIISRHIELLLDYCSRFYDRQFITRNEANNQILDKTESLLEEYIRSGKLKSRTLPSAQYCSDILHVSPAYFNDLLKFETGKTIESYFQLKRIETARKRLLFTDRPTERIAEELGFSDLHGFSALFRKITGTMPEEYRQIRN